MRSRPCMRSANPSGATAMGHGAPCSSRSAVLPSVIRPVAPWWVEPTTSRPAPRSSAQSWSTWAAEEPGDRERLERNTVERGFDGGQAGERGAADLVLEGVTSAEPERNAHGGRRRRPRPAPRWRGRAAQRAPRLRDRGAAGRHRRRWAGSHDLPGCGMRRRMLTLPPTSALEGSRSRRRPRAGRRGRGSAPCAARPPTRCRASRGRAGRVRASRRRGGRRSSDSRASSSSA